MKGALNDETILLVEDDATLRFSLSMALKSEGYRVVVASDGDEGLERALREPPDLVLLDVMMPKRNGFEVLRELRAHDPLLPVLLVTARGEEEDRVRGLKPEVTTTSSSRSGWPSCWRVSVRRSAGGARCARRARRPRSPTSWWIWTPTRCCAPVRPCR